MRFEEDYSGWEVLLQHIKHTHSDWGKLESEHMGNKLRTVYFCKLCCRLEIHEYEPQFEEMEDYY